MYDRDIPVRYVVLLCAMAVALPIAGLYYYNQLPLVEACDIRTANHYLAESKKPHPPEETKALLVRLDELMAQCKAGMLAEAAAPPPPPQPEPKQQPVAAAPLTPDYSEEVCTEDPAWWHDNATMEREVEDCQNPHLHSPDKAVTCINDAHDSWAAKWLPICNVRSQAYLRNHGVK